MRNHECVIGIIGGYEYYETVTVDELKKHIEETADYNEGLKEDGIYVPWLVKTEWSLKDYCDKRRNTDLTRFDYCPYCGKKIEWKKIKEEGE